VNSSAHRINVLFTSKWFTSYYIVVVTVEVRYILHWNIDQTPMNS